MIWKKKISFWLWTIFLLSYWKHMTPGYFLFMKFVIIGQINPFFSKFVILYDYEVFYGYTIAEQTS